jgi:hypothetical protein
MPGSPARGLALAAGDADLAVGDFVGEQGVDLMAEVLVGLEQWARLTGKLAARGRAASMARETVGRRCRTQTAGMVPGIRHID